VPDNKRPPLPEMARNIQCGESAYYRTDDEFPMLVPNPTEKPADLATNTIENRANGTTVPRMAPCSANSHKKIENDNRDPDYQYEIEKNLKQIRFTHLLSPPYIIQHFVPYCQVSLFCPLRDTLHTYENRRRGKT